MKNIHIDKPTTYNEQERKELNDFIVTTPSYEVPTTKPGETTEEK